MAVTRIGISNPEYETENLRYLNIQSSYLKGRGDISVFVPPNSKNSTHLPIAILLHGVYGSHWAWTRHMNVHHVALNLIEKGVLPPMVLLMPSDGLWGEGSGYLQHSGKDFEQWIAKDALDAAISSIPQISKNSLKFICGLSMGGYGALRIGAKYPSIFKAFSGHSSITDLDQMSLFVEEDLKTYNPQNNDESVFKYLELNKEKLPTFRFDCGTEDPLIGYNQKLHQQLITLEIPHTYEEFDGGHTAEYWHEHIVTTLKFFGSFC
jgi:enterochelin esterase-like enzyme